MCGGSFRAPGAGAGPGQAKDKVGGSRETEGEEEPFGGRGAASDERPERGDPAGKDAEAGGAGGAWDRCRAVWPACAE